MAQVKVALDLPKGIDSAEWSQTDERFTFEITIPLPPQCQCGKCGQHQEANCHPKGDIRVVRDLDLWGKPTFFVYQPYFHLCGRCGHRQEIIPAFRRRNAMYTYRFENWILDLLRGSTVEAVAQRVGIDADTVERIVKNQLADHHPIDPQRKIIDVGLDEISLKKRHRLYVTILTDLSDPDQPQVLAVAKGRDTAAAEACLLKLSAKQRQQVRHHRTDMSTVYPSVCGDLLPNSQLVIDRFHVAKLLGDIVDKIRRDVTRAHKKRLCSAERKAFRSLMWEFRCRPETLTPTQKQDLENLFDEIPELGFTYHFRWRVTEIFDSATSRHSAAVQIARLRKEIAEYDPVGVSRFFETYDRWRGGILAYFDEGKTSGVVEGINNKARVITKRCYGLKSVKSFFERIVLDLNNTFAKVGHKVAEIRETIKRIRAKYLAYYT